MKAGTIKKVCSNEQTPRLKSWAARLATVGIALLLVVVVLLSPSFQQFLKSAGSVLRGGNAQAISMFVVLKCGYSGWGVFLLGVLTAWIPGASAIGLQEAAFQLFTPLQAGISYWGGLAVGYASLAAVLWVWLAPLVRWVWRTRKDGASKPRRLSRTQRVAMIVAAGLAIACAVAYLSIEPLRAWVTHAIHILSGNPAGVATYLRSFGAVGPIVSALLMVLQSVLAPIPAFIITFANGMIWGFVGGALLSWSSAMAGAAICFWIARIFGRPLVEKLAGGSKALEVSDLFFERYGSRTVLVARLLPFVSFDLISYGAGLTDISFWRFLLATGLGQLPATLVYSYLASIGGAASSVRILLYVFVGTAVLMIVLGSFREPFMRRLRGESKAEEQSA